MATKINTRWLSDNDYDFIFRRVPRLCVDIIVKDKKGVLLTFRKIPPVPNVWHIPGGRVHFRETIENAVKRIAKKEIGLTVSVKKILGFMEFDREIQYGKKRHSVSIAVEVKRMSGTIKVDFQSDKLGFFKKIPKDMYVIHGNFLKKQKILK